MTGSTPEDSNQEYIIKNIRFNGPKRILMQTKNGPCPLLGIANVLLLRNQIRIPDDKKTTTLGELLQIVTNLMLDKKPQDDRGSVSSSGSRNLASATFQGNLEGCLNVLPKLHEGMDVNVQFRDVRAFEFTQELGIFDLLEIGLMHGWIVSKQDETMFNLLKDESYNTLVERIIKLSEKEEDSGEATLLRCWLDDTMSQLTYDGLQELHENILDHELAVLFRNAHFTTVYKRENRLYLLNTDIGFLDSELIWEQFDEVDGDTIHVRNDFTPLPSTKQRPKLLSDRPLNSRDRSNPRDMEMTQMDRMESGNLREPLILDAPGRTRCIPYWVISLSLVITIGVFMSLYVWRR